jgi:hypothetical protein
VGGQRAVALRPAAALHAILAAPRRGRRSLTTGHVTGLLPSDDRQLVRRVLKFVGLSDDQLKTARWVTDRRGSHAVQFIAGAGFDFGELKAGWIDGCSRVAAALPGLGALTQASGSGLALPSDKAKQSLAACPVEVLKNHFGLRKLDIPAEAASLIEEARARAVQG